MSTQKVYRFMAQRKFWAAVSALLILSSIVSLATKQLNLGLDFTGGTLVEVAYEGAPDLDALRESLDGAGFKGVSVVNYGTEKDVLVRMQDAQSADFQSKLEPVLRQDGAGNAEIRRVEVVGAQVGDELKEMGGLAVLVTLFGVLVYVAFRFQYKLAVGAIVALIHDVLAILGLFSFFEWDFDLTVLAAVLAIIGYSVNDTIVVFDRIRENFRSMRQTGVEEIVDTSLTQTLDRTIMTNAMTSLVVLALFFFGGEVIHGFATAMVIGMVVGTYSSIYVAANVSVALKVKPEDLMEPVKEGIEDDGRP